MRPTTDPRPSGRQAERHGNRLMRPAPPFLGLAAVLAIIGVVLIIVGWGWAWALGIVLVVLAGPPAVIGIALGAAGVVTRWAARDKPFA